MIDPRIHRALAAAGIFLLVTYTAGLGFALTRAPASHPATPPPAAAAPEADDDRAYYRVTTKDGQEHVIDVDPLDAAGALLTASERYGEGVTVTRIDPEQARANMGAHGASTGSPPWSWLALLLLLIPLWFLFAARREGQRYGRLQAVWERLQPRLGYSAKRLMEDVAIGERELQASLATLNERMGTELMWDQPTGQVVDARLSHFTLVLNHCPRCNTAIHARVRADLLSPPKCNACMLPFEGQELEHQRAKIVTRLLSDNPDGPAGPAKRSFSLLYFLLWVIVFPPVAIVYARASAK